MADESKGIMAEFEETLGKYLLEVILTKLLPQIEPVSNQIKKILGNDEKRIMLQIISGELCLIVVETAGITAMEIQEDKFKVYQLDKYKDMLLNGGIEEIMKEVQS